MNKLQKLTLLLTISILPWHAMAEEDTVESQDEPQQEQTESDEVISEDIAPQPAPEAYDPRCYGVSLRLAQTPGALTFGEIELLENCLASLRRGATVDTSMTLDCDQICPAPPPPTPPPAPACPPVPAPDLEALCPPFMQEQRRRRSEERGPVRIRPHIPGA